MGEKMSDVELIIDAKAQVGEGAIWDSDRRLLYWIDIMESTLFAYDPATGENRAYPVGEHVGTVVPKNASEVALATVGGFALYSLETQTLTRLNDPEADRPGNRFNDGKCDPAGRFWAGTMAYASTEGAGSLYCMEADLSVRRMLEDVTISNGIVWSLDQSKMYFVDTPTFAVQAFDFDIATGVISNGRTALRIPSDAGAPDGMTIDAEGMLWIAHWGGGRVCRWHPESGELLQTIRVPASQTTSCAFGGDNLDVLYITSAALGLSAAQIEREPFAGGLFATQPGSRGVPAFGFAG